jgi:hypothetical protein
MHILQWLAVEADSAEEAATVIREQLKEILELSEQALERQYELEEGFEDEDDYDIEEYSDEDQDILDNITWFEGFITGAPKFLASTAENMFTHTLDTIVKGTNKEMVKNVLADVENSRDKNFNNSWDENTLFYDWVSDTALVEDFVSRVETDPKRQFLIPVDFKIP